MTTKIVRTIKSLIYELRVLYIVFCVLGTKLDLRKEAGGPSSDKTHHVHKDEGKALAKQLNLQGYFECSAKTHEGVDEVLHLLSIQLKAPHVREALIHSLFSDVFLQVFEQLVQLVRAKKKAMEPSCFPFLH